jgi:hypothetical protein
MAAAEFKAAGHEADGPTLSDKAHFYGSLSGFPNLICVTALVCKRMLAAGGVAGSAEMPDVVMLAIGFGFFALSVGYAMACDQL